MGVGLFCISPSGELGLFSFTHFQDTVTDGSKELGSGGVC